MFPYQEHFPWPINSYSKESKGYQLSRSWKTTKWVDANENFRIQQINSRLSFLFYYFFETAFSTSTRNAWKSEFAEIAWHYVKMRFLQPIFRSSSQIFLAGRAATGSSDWHFNKLSGSHHYSLIEIYYCRSSVTSPVCVNWLVSLAVTLWCIVCPDWSHASKC